MKKYSVILTTVLALSMVLTACGPTTTPTEAPHKTEPTEEPTTQVSNLRRSPTQVLRHLFAAVKRRVNTFPMGRRILTEDSTKIQLNVSRASAQLVTVNQTPDPADFQTKLKDTEGWRYFFQTLVCGRSLMTGLCTLLASSIIG